MLPTSLNHFVLREIVYIGTIIQILCLVSLIETNIISRRANHCCTKCVAICAGINQFGAVDVQVLWKKVFCADFWRKVLVQFALGSISCVCAANDSAGDVHPSPGSSSSSLKPQIVEISQNLLLMLLPNAFSLPAGQKSTSEITLLFWRRDEDARSQTISPVTSSRPGRPGRHGRPRDHEWCREKAMKASFSQDSQRRLAADG